jgi:hypothetical protein
LSKYVKFYLFEAKYALIKIIKRPMIFQIYIFRKSEKPINKKLRIEEKILNLLGITEAIIVTMYYIEFLSLIEATERIMI